MKKIKIDPNTILVYVMGGTVIGSYFGRLHGAIIGAILGGLFGLYDCLSNQ